MSNKPSPLIQAQAAAEAAAVDELLDHTRRMMARAQAIPDPTIAVVSAVDPDAVEVVAPSPPAIESEAAMARWRRAERAWVASVLRLAVANRRWRMVVAASVQRALTRLVARLRLGPRGRRRRLGGRSRSRSLDPPGRTPPATAGHRYQANHRRPINDKLSSAARVGGGS